MKPFKAVNSLAAGVFAQFLVLFISVTAFIWLGKIGGIICTVAIFAAWVAWRVKVLRAIKHEYPNRNRRLCDYCGYDLRATPDRCPECGKKVKTSAFPP